MNGGMELYLHMPFCVRKCAYCDFLSFPTDQEDPEPVHEAAQGRY